MSNLNNLNEQIETELEDRSTLFGVIKKYNPPQLIIFTEGMKSTQGGVSGLGETSCGIIGS